MTVLLIILALVLGTAPTVARPCRWLSSSLRTALDQKFGQNKFEVKFGVTEDWSRRRTLKNVFLDGG